MFLNELYRHDLSVEKLNEGIYDDEPSDEIEVPTPEVDPSESACLNWKYSGQ